MKILWNLSRILVFVCLLNFGSVIYVSAQMVRPQGETSRTAPGGASGVPPSSRMTPTGLQATGGSIANDVYSNSVYGFSIKIPPGWVVRPSPDSKVANPDAALLKGTQISRPLLIVTENAPLKKSNQRKNIQIIATRLRATAGPTAARDSLAFTQKTVKEKGMDVEFLGDPQEVTINGQKLWKLASNEPSNGVVQHVEQYVTDRESILLQFLLVSPDEAGLKQLEPSIQSLEFKAMAPKAATKEPVKKAKAPPRADSKAQSTGSTPQ